MLGRTYRARHLLATNIADFFNFALLSKTVPRTKRHFRYHDNIKGWRTKKAPRDIDNVSWAVGKSFFYVFLFTNQTKLFKRQGGQRLGLTTGRHRQPSQPRWQLRLDKGGLEIHFEPSVCSPFNFFLPYLISSGITIVSEDDVPRRQWTNGR